MMGRMRGSLLAAAVVLAAWPAFGQMTLPGKFEVTDTGSASYTIPISVVPGTAGLEPKLSLQYDSRGGNGLLGVGWSLAGLPAITRCGKTIAQDGQVGGVSYDVNDRFCLDGQRLIAINGGTYGADQTEYRTERESFSKVVSYGTAGSGPAWFKVWTKAGLVMEFGNTADSRIEAQGKASVRVWAINRTSDTKGNYFSVSYTEDTANGEYRPARIDYTGNGSNAPANSVRFVYETRPDIVPFYQFGSLIKTTQRMTKLQSWQGAALTREYTLAYEVSAGSNRSRLTGVTLCTANAICLPATQPTWSNAMASMVYVEASVADAETLDMQHAIPADFNGDGITDILWCYQDSKGRCMTAATAAPRTSYTLWLGSSSGVFTVLSNLASNVSTLNAQKPILGDYNGDGLTDILWCYQEDYGRCMKNAGSNSTFTMWLAKGDGTFNVVTNAAPAGLPSNFDYQMPFAADFNGDGVTDILWCMPDGTYGYCRGRNAVGTAYPTYTLWIGNGDGTFRYVTDNVASDVATLDIQKPILGDYNGDGLTDILWCNDEAYGTVGRCMRNSGSNSTFTMWLAKGDGTFNRIAGVAPPDLPSGFDFQMPITGDFNGDGVTDILWCMPDGSYGYCRSRNVTSGYYPSYTVWLGNGDGTFRYVVNDVASDVATLDIQMAIPGDYNGDGLTDILWCNDETYGVVGRCMRNSGSNTTFTMWLAKGDGTFNRVASAAPSGLPASFDYQMPIQGDYNGDGIADILWCMPDGSYGYCRSRNATAGYYPSYMLWMGNQGLMAKGDQATAIASGLATITQLAYTPLSQGGQVYARDAGMAACVYPCMDMQGPMYVVSEVKSSNGLGISGTGGEYRSTYRYAGAKADSHGRGFLGFRRMTVKDEQTGVEQITSYRQDYPFTGLAAGREKRLGAQLLNRSTNTYNSVDLGGTRRYPFLTQSLEESWELSGAALPAVTTGYQYDAFGNATQVSVSTGDGHSKTTVNTYSNDSTNWLLGRLTRSEVTSTTPGN